MTQWWVRNIFIKSPNQLPAIEIYSGQLFYRSYNYYFSSAGKYTI